MRLNEVFSPLKESYSVVSPDDYEKYHDVIKEYIANGYIIYRGMENTGALVLGSGNDMERRAANTQNYVNTLVDYILPAWSDFPKRSKSFICSTSLQDAENFGDRIFVVIPLEGQKIAFSPSSDFWEAFDWDVDSLNAMLASFFHKAAKAGYIDQKYTKLVNHIPPQELQALIKRLSMLSNEEIKDIAKSVDYDDFYGDVMDAGGLEKFLINTLSPADFNIINAPAKFPPVNVEVWMSGKVLFVRYDVFKGMIP